MSKSIADYMDELKAEDVVCRICAYKKLEQIGIALGPNRASKELLPFLEDAAWDEEDEVRVVLAEELKPSFALLCAANARKSMFKMLEKLAGAEEALIRNAAIENLKLFIREDEGAEEIGVFVDMFKRLGADYWYTRKVAAASILPDILQRMRTGGEELIGMVANYLEDESPMVRRGAIPCLSQLAGVMSKELLEKCLKLASEDAQDSVRLLTMELAVAASAHVDVGSLISQLLKDQSWRVRFMVAQQLPKLQTQSNDNANGTLEAYEGFLLLLEDGEQEVRAAAAENLAEMGKLLGYTPTLVQAVQRACHDPSMHVRAAIATQLNALSSLAGPQATRTDIMPLLEELMRDEASQVRLNVVSRLDTLNQVIGVGELSGSLLPAIKALAGDRQWRVRQAILGYFPVLARHLGPSAELTQLATSWLMDSVHSVRRSAAKCLFELSGAFGREWTCSLLKTELSGLLLTGKPSYLKRQAIVLVLTLIDPRGEVMGELWEVVKRDPIGNVRMLVPAEMALEDAEEEDADVLYVRANPPILAAESTA